MELAPPSRTELGKGGDAASEAYSDADAATAAGRAANDGPAAGCRAAVLPTDGAVEDPGAPGNCRARANPGEAAVGGGSGGDSRGEEGLTCVVLLSKRTRAARFNRWGCYEGLYAGLYGNNNEYLYHARA